MKNLGAKWTITDVQGGRSVFYENFVDNKSHDCGVERGDTPLDMIIMFIVSQGDPGDMVFLNGTFYTQVHKELTRWPS